MGPGLRRDDTEFVVTAVANNSTLQNITGTILLAGAGKMGGAMLTGWLAGGLDPRRVAVIDPHISPEIIALAERGVVLNPDVTAAGTVETLVAAVKPQMFREAGAKLKPFVSDKTAVVSIMAGTTIASLEEVCGGAVVRAMPNTPAAIGRGTRGADGRARPARSDDPRHRGGDEAVEGIGEVRKRAVGWAKRSVPHP